MQNKYKDYTQTEVWWALHEVRKTHRWRKIAHPRFMKYVGYHLRFEWLCIFNCCDTAKDAAEFALEYTLKNWDR
jgi:hypothetical protein